jgi:MFS family permease
VLPPSARDRISVPTPEAIAERGGYVAALLACAANLLSYFAIGAVVPVLPLYMRASLHASDVSIGVVMASYSVTTLFCRPIGGLWGDRVGYRRPAMVGAVLILAGTVSYGVVPSAVWLFACRLVVGAGEGLSQAACITWAVSLAPARSRAAVLSYAGVSGWAGVALGALVGDAVLARAGHQGAFLCGAAAPLLGLCVLVRVPSARAEARTRASMARLVRALARQGAAYALVTVGYAGVLTFGALLLQSSGTPATPSLLLRAFVGGVIAGRVLFADLPARLGPARTASLCAVIQAAGTFAVAIFAAHPWWVMAGGAMAGTAFGLSFPSLALDALGRVSESDRGVAIGIVSAFFDVGLAASGVLLGSIAKGYGYPAAFVFAAACAAMAGALSRESRGPCRQSRARPPPGCQACRSARAAA